MIESHLKFRMNGGAILQRQVDYEPAPIQPGTKVRVGGSDGHPILQDAPECINCVVHESELIVGDSNERCLYRVIQTFIQE